MKLLTHNMLKSHVKGVKNGYPLLLRVRLSALLPLSFSFSLSVSLTTFALRESVYRLYTLMENCLGGKGEKEGSRTADFLFFFFSLFLCVCNVDVLFKGVVASFEGVVVYIAYASSR